MYSVNLCTCELHLSASARGTPTDGGFWPHKMKSKQFKSSQNVGDRPNDHHQPVCLTMTPVNKTAMEHYCRIPTMPQDQNDFSISSSTSPLTSPGAKASRSSSPNSLRVVFVVSIMVISSMYMNMTLNLHQAVDTLQGSEAYREVEEQSRRILLLRVNSTNSEMDSEGVEKPSASQTLLRINDTHMYKIQDTQKQVVPLPSEPKIRRKPQVALLLTYPNSVGFPPLAALRSGLL